MNTVLRQRLRRRARRLPAAVLTAVISLSLMGVSAFSPAAAAHVQFTTPPIESWRLDGQGFAVVVVGDTAYVGGQFTTARSSTGQTPTTRLDLSAFDVRTGNLVSSFRADTDGVVRALATDGNRLFVGGDFSTIGGVARPNLAAIDLVTGDVDTSWVGSATNVVWALTVEAGVLYVGGSFNKLNGVPRSRLGALDAATGALGSWAPSSDGSIRGLAADPVNGFVYAAGRHSTINDQVSNDLSKIDLAGQLVPLTFPELGDDGSSVDLNGDGSRIAVAGADNRVHYFNTSTGARLWRQFCQGNAQAVKVIEDAVVAGYHDGCNNVYGRDLMVLDAATGVRDESFLPIFDQFWGVRAVDGDATVLVAVGKMKLVDGRTVGSFAIFPAG